MTGVTTSGGRSGALRAEPATPSRAKPPAANAWLDDALGTLSWIILQAEGAMAISAGCSMTSGDPEGALQMLNSIASDIAINAEMLSEKINGNASAGSDHETWESINQWCDDTFGKATIPQIIARAKEEFDELEADGANHAIEAADVVICLCRIPGFADALQTKMAINRNRKWRLTGGGTGYHIPEQSA